MELKLLLSNDPFLSLVFVFHPLGPVVVSHWCTTSTVS